MIKKLERIIEYTNESTVTSARLSSTALESSRLPDQGVIFDKINEIIDVVNDESGFNREIDELKK